MKLNLYQKLFRKRMAFRAVFNPDKPEGKIVLAELKRVCPSNPAAGAGSPIDEKQVFINIGRRQVLNHILGIVNMTDEKLNEITREEELNGY